MKVYVNDREIYLLVGMTVKHALIKAGLIDMVEKGKTPCDEAGHEIGLGGTLSEGEKIYLR